MKLSIITATYNRPDKLSAIALSSLLAQTDCDFEWVVINDGANHHSKEIIKDLIAPFSTTYIETKHSETGFGLCHARNAGIRAATGNLISYLDDDNKLFPEFVANTKSFFKTNSYVKYSMTLQNRRRDVVKNNKTVTAGKTFISPNTDCTIEELILQNQIFDSNGFTHCNNDSLQWNPDYKVFADYEFLLQCTNLFNRTTFQLNSQILVKYIQSSIGAIGSSTYQQWGNELKQLVNDNIHYKLKKNEIENLVYLSTKYLAKGNKKLNAFVKNKA
ncbi:MAG: glycosyltransferase family A protein [Cyanobacteria bacterium J06635_10]